MPNFSLNTAVGAGGVVANALAGSAFEFVGRPSRVAIAMVTDATTAGDVTATVQFGPEVQLEEGVLASVGANALVGPKMPDDIVVDDVAAAGDRLVVRLSNANAAAAVVQIKVRIIPIQ